MYPQTRLRRLRQNKFVRDLVEETQLSSQDLILPMFVQEGQNALTPIPAMPGISRYTMDCLVEEAKTIADLGIPAIALFPVIDAGQKTPCAKEAFADGGLIQQTVALLKKEVPRLGVITDVALDPYTSHGQDGLLNEKNDVDNDTTIEVLCKQALSHAKAGADIVAPSDMMDGRIGQIRQYLDKHGFQSVSILAYSAKFASHYYGPFREAIGSHQSLGKANKKTYQLNPANRKEAFREVELDINESADIIMVKPGMPYLDIVSAIKRLYHCPIFVYQVSGEYSMHMAAIQNGWLSNEALLESVLCLKRAGADAILSYAAKTVAEYLS